MDKQLKRYFKSIKKNLPCYNSAMRKMLGDLKISVTDYITQNGCTEFQEIEKHFGTAEYIAEEFAAGIDGAYIKSYKFKKRVTAIILSILAVIAIIVASLSIYIYIENEKHTPIFYNDKITYNEDK